MKNIKHPAFLLGIAAFILLIISAGIRSSGYALGRYLPILAGIMGLASWIWSIIDVVSRSDMKPFLESIMMHVKTGLQSRG